MYVGKGYLNDGLFKLIIMTIEPKFINNNITSFAYMVQSSNVWHGRLWHVNHDTMRKLIKLNYLPKFDRIINVKHMQNLKLQKHLFNL